MTEDGPREAIGRASVFAMRLARDQTDPATARRDFAELLDDLPGVRGRVVVTTEPYGGSRDYDLLITHEHGTHVVGFAPAGSPPWPLRGSHSPTEQDVVRVNGTVLRMQQAMTWLDGLWKRPRLLRRLVDLCLVEEELAAREDAVDAEINDALLQRRMDEFRLRRGLACAADTHRWLADHGMTHHLLEQRLLGQLRFEVLREQVVGAEADQVLHEAPDAVDTLAVALLLSPDPDLCAAVHALCSDGGLPLESAAGRLARGAARSPGAAGTAGTARVSFRRQVRHSAAGPVAALFPDTVAEGTVTLPYREDDGYAVAQKLAPAVRSADTEANRAALRDLLFDRWLAERRRVADVEWYWGREHSGPP